MARNIYRPRLRILLDPVYIQISNLSGSSTYHRFVTIAEEMVRRGHFVYWMVPDTEYTPHPIEDHPNVGIIRTSAVQDQFIAEGLITDDFFNLFNRIAGKYHIDAICTYRTGLALYYKRILEAPRFHDTDGEYTDKSYGLPVVILEGFPQTRQQQHTARAYWMMQCQGYLGADRTIFSSSHNREEVVREMNETFQTSAIRRWTERTRLIAPGVNCDELEQYRDIKRWKVEKGFKVISIGRIFGQSHIEYIPWFDYLYKAGLSDVSLTVSLSGGFGGPMRHKLESVGFDTKGNTGKQFHVITNNPRKNFLKMLRRYHAFICPVSHYDHPTGLFEALYLGLPGIIPVSDYQQTFFKDYPFVIEPRDKAALLAQLLWIRDNRAEARKRIQPWKDIIREQYNTSTNVRLVVDEVEAVARDSINRFKTSGAVLKFLGELKGKSYNWGDVVTYLRKSGNIGISIGNMKVRSTFTYSRGAIHHAMGMAGYVDVCDGPEERFMRKDVFKKRYDK